MNHFSFVSLILFMKKSDRELQFCINYQALNMIMIWNQYSIFLIQEILNWFLKTWYFMKLNIIVVFNWIHIHESNEKYTAFQTQWELFEQLMMSFNLKNEFNIFQHYINDKLYNFLDIFVIMYIDDILIYSFTLFKH